jgi:hypothetical protein
VIEVYHGSQENMGFSLSPSVPDPLTECSDLPEIAMKELAYTAITSQGMTYDIRFPLHPESGSPAAIGAILTAVLDVLSTNLGSSAKVSDGDVLQALAMAAAVRARMTGSDPAVSGRLVHELIDEALAAVFDASAYRAARA